MTHHAGVTEPEGHEEPRAAPAPIADQRRGAYARLWRFLGGGREHVEVVAVEGEALERADRLAAAAIAFVLVGAIGGGILEIVYALIE